MSAPGSESVERYPDRTGLVGETVIGANEKRVLFNNAEQANPAPPHRESDEKAIVHVEDRNHPITRAFGGKSFQLIDEVYRFQAPFSRERLRVLLTVDPASVNGQQGRCYGRCFRDDNDYAVAWIRQHGKGRIFYTALGHNPDLFWDPRMLETFLAGTQYALGDLDADATPKPRDTRRVER